MSMTIVSSKIRRILYAVWKVKESSEKIERGEFKSCIRSLYMYIFYGKLICTILVRTM